MSLPTSFLDRMKAELGPAFPDFLVALDQPPPVSIRLNPAKPSAVFPDAERMPWHPDGRYLSERPVFTLDPAFHAGAYYVQEASSMLIHEALRQMLPSAQSLRVLDLCAAPGGKSTLLLSAIGPDSFLLSNEAIQGRIAPLKMNLEKWGHANVAVSNHDPDDFGRLANYFDVVLVDAPCSGEGLFRKDDEAAAHWSEATVALCAARQRRILSAASGLVKPGGLLLYSTCTFNATENEDNVRWLVEQEGFGYEPLALPTEWGVVEKAYGHQCYPHRVRGEGFFLACLRKMGDANPQPIKATVPKDWQRVPDKQRPVLEAWLRQADAYEYFVKPEGTVVAVPTHLAEVFFTIGSALKKRSLGLEIGEMKQRDFVPSHTLALANGLHPDLPKAQLDRVGALQYLKKENLWSADWGRGWTLATYNDLPLGWLKVLDNRSNNYLPTHWRIRMDVQASDLK